MTMHHAPSEIELDIGPARRMLCRANAFVLASLPQIVDVSRLREGDAEEDYFVDIPSHRLHDVGDLIAHLEFVTLKRFDVGLGVMPIPSKALRAAK